MSDAAADRSDRPQPQFRLVFANASANQRFPFYEQAHFNPEFARAEGLRVIDRLLQVGINPQSHPGYIEGPDREGQKRIEL